MADFQIVEPEGWNGQIVEPEGWNGQIVEPEGWDGVIVEPEAQSQTAPAAVPVAAPRPNSHRILPDGTPISIDTGEADWDGFNNPGGTASVGESMAGNFKAVGNDWVANVGGAIQAAAEESLANPLGHGGKEGWRRPLSEDELQRKQEYWEGQRETGEQMHRFSRELAEHNVPENQSTGGKFAGDVVRAGVGSLLPMIGAGIVTGGSAVPLAFMGSQVYGGKYADARAAGRSEAEANQDALFSATAEIFTEKVPVEYLLKPGGRFLEAALKGSVLEGAQEGFVSVLQSMYDAGALPENGTFGDALAAMKEWEPWKEALYSAAVGGVLGASVAGPMGELQYQSDFSRYKAERGDLAQGAIKPLPVEPGGNGEVVRTPVEPIPDETIDFIENEPVSSPVAEPALESVVYPSAIPAQPKIIEADLPDKDKPDDELDAQPAQAAPVEIVEPEGFDFGAKETVVADTEDSDVTLIDPDQIQVDAKTFQFKSQTDDEGLSDQLRGTKQWDSTASGVSVVWESVNGDQFIVDGHQRLGLAKRLKAEGQSPKIRAFVLKEADGVSAGEARKIGAIKNLQEGGESTSAIDVAKVMRDGAAIDDIADVVPPNRSAFRDGKGLAKLGEHSFGLVVNEEIDPGHAAIVGDLITDHQEQVAAITVLQRVSPQNNDQARMVVEQTVRAGFEKRIGDSQGDMFGTESMVDDLVGERVKVLDSTLKRLKSMKRVFNSAVLNQAALESAGNVIDAQSSKTQVTDNARTIENIARLANTTGPISEALDAAARQVQSGVAVPVAVNGFLEGISGSQGNGQENNRSREKSKGRLEPPPEPVSEPVSKQPQAPSSEGVSDSGESIPDKSSVDSQAHEAATSSENDLPSPTESQIEAGTYKKGHPVINGLQISIENPAGSKRRPEWPTLKSHYGYVKGVPARAPDKEHVDVFVKPGTEEGFSGDVFVIDQFHANGKFDEPKVMIGYAGEAEAQSAYQENFTKDWKGGKPATRLTMDDFKARLQDTKGFMKPVGEPSVAKKRKNFSWDAVELSENYTVKELESWIHEIRDDPGNKNEPGGINIYNKEATRKLDKLSWAVHHIVKDGRGDSLTSKVEDEAAKQAEIQALDDKKKGLLSDVVAGVNKEQSEEEGLGDSDLITPDLKPSITDPEVTTKPPITGTFSASDISVKGHHQSASIKDGIITVASHTGKKKPSLFSFPLAAWQAAESRGELVRANADNNSLPDDIIASMVLAVEKAETRANKSSANADKQSDDKKSVVLLPKKRVTNNASKLRKAAAQLNEKAIADMGQDRQENTRKRAAEASSARDKAANNKAIAETMMRVADAIDSGEVNYLDKVSSRTHFVQLNSYLNNARIDRQRAEKKSYSETQKERGAPYTEKDIEYAKLRKPGALGSMIRRPALKLRDRRGYKQLAQRILDRAGTRDDYIEFSTEPQIKDFREFVKALDKDEAGWAADENIKNYDRAIRIGATSTKELQAMLREYITYKQGAAKENPIKAKERSLIGQKIPGFFPTPPAVIDRMLAAADIPAGATVLEPSAGTGNIAKAAKDAGAHVVTLEVNQTLSEILEAKGFDVAGRDFLAHEENYDHILMNPPFEKGADIDHVRHAYELLNPGGRIVAVMSEGPFYRSDNKATDFRDWLDAAGWSEKLPEGSFKGTKEVSQTGVSARMVVIDRPEIRLRSSAPAGVMFSRGGNFDSEIKASIQSTDEVFLNGVVRVGNTPKVLLALGVKNLPLGISRATINKVHFDHGLVERVIGTLPTLISDPLMVFDSATRPGTFVLVLDEVVRGSPLIVAFHPNKKLGRAEINFIASAYPKDNPRIMQRWVDDGLLRYRHTKKSQRWETTSRLRLPRVGPTKADSTGKVLTERDVVKSLNAGLYSKDETGPGITREEAIAAIEAKAGKGAIDRLGDDLFIPNTRAELEAGMLDRGFSAEELIFSDETQAGDPLDDSKGFYDPSTDTTYLLPFNMQSVDEAWPIFVHEVGTHYGLERILGKSKYNSLIEDVEIMVRGGSPKILAAMRHVNLFEGLNLDSESRSFRADYAEKMMGDHRITQETIAYLAQHNVDMPLIKRIVAAVKVFLLKMGVKVRLAENDVVAIVIAAAKRAGTIARNKARDQASVDEVSGGIDETPGTAEYQSAVEKGLGMSKDSRMQRAVDMGAVTDLDSLYEQQAIKQGRERVSEGDESSADASGNTRSAGAVAASPQLLFHGTADDVSGFAPGHRNRKDAGWLGRGTYLTDRHELANGYADLKRGDAAPNVMPLIAMLSNPYIATLEDKARLSRSPIAEVDAFTNDLKEQGYDGVILAYRDVKEIVVFDPTKVRSVHAAFDPDQAGSRNLLFSKPSRKYTPSQEAAIRQGGFGLRQSAKFKTRFDELKYRATNKLRQGMVDQYDSFRSILGDNRAWMMGHLSSSYNGALEAVLEMGSIALKEDVITVDQSQKSLEEVLAPLGEELDDWLMWVAGNRSDRLATEGRERLFRDADIDALKSLADGVMDDGRHRPLVYETVRQDFEKLSQSINQVGVDTGLINQEEAQAWADQGFYLPFYRMVEETGDARGPRSFGNGLVRQTAYKKLTGADLQLDDLLTNLLMNWSHLLGASLKNQSAVAALDTAVEIGLAEQVDENEKGKNSVFVRKNGREVWYNIADDQDGALVFDSLVSLNQTPFNNLAMKGFRKFKRALTMGVTASPEFKLANLFRDTFQAIAVADMSTNIAKNLYQGFKATKKGHDTIAQMIAGGGAFGDSGYIHGADPDAVKLLIKKGISRDTILTPRVLMNVWDKWQDVGARLENVNRAANFEQALDDGKSLLEANFESRDHLDFSRTGTFIGIRFLAQVVPFLNARLQGLDKMGRAGMDKNQQAQFAAVITAYSAVSAMLYLAMKDDDDYKEAEEWERDSYHLFKLPGSDIMYRLPRPFEVGAIASMSERLVEQMVDDDVHGALFAERLGHTLKHTFAFNPTPQAVKPMLEIYANKNAFTGRPIESMSVKNLSPAERKRVWTSQTAVKTSAVMDSVVWDDVVLSPVQMEHLVRGYFGWLGTTALAGSDSIIESAMDLPVKPAKKITDYPIVKRFARQGQGRSSKYITTFYERLNETTETFNDMKQARLDADADKQQEIYDDKAGVLRSRKRLSSVQRKLAKYRRQIASVHRSRSMTATQKRAEIDRLQAGMNAWAKVAVEDTNFNFQ